MHSDEEYLMMVFSLARRGEGETSPNPIVGAIVVKDGRVAGKGFHWRAGEKHAEIAALDEAGEAARDATLYLNLEPCCHYGKTPPCCDRIIKAGIRKVVCSMQDPNPMVNGRGFNQLRSSGIFVEEGLLRKEAERLNEVFVKFVRTGHPFVIAKAAMSLDGKIASSGGESKWISSPGTREYIHNRIRFCVDAIMVGINTLLLDDPLLTVRGSADRKKKVVRVVLDSFLRTPLNSRMFESLDQGEIWIYTTEKGDMKARDKLEAAGASIVTVGEEDGKCRLSDVLLNLGGRGVSSVLIEGGSQTLASAFKGRFVDKVYFFIAPSIIGEKNSIVAIGDLLQRGLSQSIQIDNIDTLPIDGDLMLRGYPVYR
ncbi:MAG: bifunctional diaminohydroxyphosphoribosylaminopyrimidine deaminase/5-amino-6-(5-phosphoribosylamino)uracil reductase RibD [Acidobacteriota bacterium]